MIILTWISAFLLIQTSQSYVLLTANLDDVQNLLSQVIQSPAVEKVGQYVRRAATMFNQHMRSRAGDEKDLKESPVVRQVVNVLRSAYTLFKEQFNVVDKDTDAPAPRKKPLSPQVDTVESSAEADVTRRRARNHLHHNRHKHSRKHYPAAHKTKSRRTDAAGSEYDKKANTEHKGDGTALASEERREKLKETSEMLALGKNASRYLTTIKEIIEKAV